MSQAIFPSFAGLKWGVSRTPQWKTAVRETASGREFRVRFQAHPRYVYRLSYEVLRETTGYAELKSLLGFFNARQGSFDTFLYTDPDDATVTAQAIGVGDGTSTQYQLVRTLGGFVEPVYDVNGTPQIFLAGVLKATPADYTINATGGVTFTAAPGSGVAITWSGSYYWRCRFMQDKTEFSQFMQKLWEAKTVEFITVKP